MQGPKNNFPKIGESVGIYRAIAVLELRVGKITIFIMISSNEKLRYL
jgi:hypothetical protein